MCIERPLPVALDFDGPGENLINGDRHDLQQSIPLKNAHHPESFSENRKILKVSVLGLWRGGVLSQNRKTYRHYLQNTFYSCLIYNVLRIDKIWGPKSL